jgi:hypothetical protein
MTRDDRRPDSRDAGLTLAPGVFSGVSAMLHATTWTWFATEPGGKS